MEGRDEKPILINMKLISKSIGDKDSDGSVVLIPEVMEVFIAFPSRNPSPSLQSHE
jgi:hypothetical protein